MQLDSPKEQYCRATHLTRKIDIRDYTQAYGHRKPRNAFNDDGQQEPLAVKSFS